VTVYLTFLKIIIVNTVCGFLADRFGRRRMALIFSVIHVSSSFATAFSTRQIILISGSQLVDRDPHLSHENLWNSISIVDY
jgi:MFS family permease